VNILDKMDYYVWGKIWKNLIFWIFEKLELRKASSN
jgi:hypothetical protein